MMRNLKAAAGALVFVAAIACGGGGAAVGPGGTTGGTGNPPPNPSSCGTNTICMQFTSPDIYSAGTGSFSPTSLSVTAGSTVTFSNNSGVAHNVVFDGAAPAGGNIGTISSGTQTRTFTTTGSYPFHCTIHAGMTGSITVQ